MRLKLKRDRYAIKIVARPNRVADDSDYIMSFDEVWTLPTFCRAEREVYERTREYGDLGFVYQVEKYNAPQT